MSKSLAHPTVPAVMAIHAEVLVAHGGSAGLRDEGAAGVSSGGSASNDDGDADVFRPYRNRGGLIFFICAATTRSWTATSGRRWQRVWCSSAKNSLLPKEGWTPMLGND